MRFYWLADDSKSQLYVANNLYKAFISIINIRLMFLLLVLPYCLEKDRALHKKAMKRGHCKYYK